MTSHNIDTTVSRRDLFEKAAMLAGAAVVLGLTGCKKDPIPEGVGAPGFGSVENGEDNNPSGNNQDPNANNNQSNNSGNNNQNNTPEITAENWESLAKSAAEARGWRYLAINPTDYGMLMNFCQDGGSLDIRLFIKYYTGSNTIEWFSDDSRGGVSHDQRKGSGLDTLPLASIYK
jgi:hypothetical protein